MANSIFFSVAPYHIISYGTLLGTTAFHTFVNAPIQFTTVSRADFSAIQTKIFPVYFAMQTAIPAVLALTFPGSTLLGLPSGVTGLMDGVVRWNSLVPIATMFVAGIVNLVLLPTTQQVMKERRGQVKRDGKEWYAEGPHSAEMQALNKKFGMLHGISSLLNLGSLISLVAYGFTLGARIAPLA
jgi:hypothetical protein